MNMNQLPGIDILGGFKVHSSQPVDVRQTVDTIQDRNSLATDNQAFAGLRVFVKATKKSYIYNGEGWDEIPNAVSLSQAMEVFSGPDVNADTNGTKGMVPAPTTNDDGKYLTTAGWTSVPNVSSSNNGFMTSAMFNKLNGVEVGANNYTHPTNHDATMITEDASHRFATDIEKAKWNNKTEVLIANAPSANMPTNSIFGEIIKTAGSDPVVPSTPTDPGTGGGGDTCGSLAQVDIDTSAMANPIELLDTAQSTAVEFYVTGYDEEHSKLVSDEIISSDINNFIDNLTFVSDNSAVTLSDTTFTHVGERKYKCTVMMNRDANVTVTPHQIINVTVNHPLATNTTSFKIVITHTSANTYHIYADSTCAAYIASDTKKFTLLTTFNVNNVGCADYDWNATETEKCIFTIRNLENEDITHLFNISTSRANIMADQYHRRVYAILKDEYTVDRIPFGSGEKKLILNIYHPDADNNPVDVVITYNR